MFNAFWRPINRGMRKEPPSPGKSPNFTSGKAIIVEVCDETTRPAHDNDTSVPPPIQAP